jgi:hypothetical protein
LESAKLKKRKPSVQFEEELKNMEALSLSSDDDGTKSENSDDDDEESVE